MFLSVLFSTGTTSPNFFPNPSASLLAFIPSPATPLDDFSNKKPNPSLIKKGP
jgi:hypothetical protein